MKQRLLPLLSLISLVLLAIPARIAWSGPLAQTVPTAPPEATFPPPQSDALGFLTQTAQAAPTLAPIAEVPLEARPQSGPPLSGYLYLLLCLVLLALGAYLFFRARRRPAGPPPPTE